MPFTRAHTFIAGIVIFFIAAGIAGFFIFKKPRRAQIPSSVFNSLPDITFQHIDGSTVSVSSLRGRSVILDVWASWCQLCSAHISPLSALQKEFGDTLVIIEVNRGESLEMVKKYLEQHSATTGLLFVLDANDSLYQAVGGFSMPETLFLDKEGRIADHTRGPIGIIEMRRRIQNLLALKP